MFLSSASGRAHRLATSFVLSGIVFGALLPGLEAHAAMGSIPSQSVVQSPVKPVASLSLEKPVDKGIPNGTLVAHHEGSGLGASQLLTTGVSSVGGGLTKSLWGNLIISMAYQQDAKIQAITKKMHRLGIFTLGSIAAISGLTIAQGIDGLVTLQQDPHPLHPPILGLVGSSLTLGTIGTQAIVGHRYKKQLLARQRDIQEQVLHVIEHLKTEGDSDHVRTNLSQLIGKEAMEEFMQIWASVHH